MASIHQRHLNDGRVRWKVAFKRLGLPHFSKTFDEYDDAVQWAEENEEKYIHNPEKYHKFREDTRDLLKQGYKKFRKRK